ncbi:MAG: hypothetical protein JWP35_4624 [Caulobacter sp.]|nr:hypothetical protein [Caulobacter sp.]
MTKREQRFFGGPVHLVKSTPPGMVLIDLPAPPPPFEGEPLAAIVPADQMLDLAMKALKCLPEPPKGTTHTVGIQGWAVGGTPEGNTVVSFTVVNGGTISFRLKGPEALSLHEGLGVHLGVIVPEKRRERAN